MFILKLFALVLLCAELQQHFSIGSSMVIAHFNNMLSSYRSLRSNECAREALLLIRLSKMLCNLDMKSIYVCFDDDKMATNMVNQVIAKIAHCSSIPVTILRYITEIVFFFQWKLK